VLSGMGTLVAFFFKIYLVFFNSLTIIGLLGTFVVNCHHCVGVWNEVPGSVLLEETSLSLTFWMFLVSTLPPSLLGIKEEIAHKALLSFYNLHCRARNWPKAKDK
jgi:hypothetical protein